MGLEAKVFKWLNEFTGETVCISNLLLSLSLSLSLSLARPRWRSGTLAGRNGWTSGSNPWLGSTFEYSHVAMMLDS